MGKDILYKSHVIVPNIDLAEKSLKYRDFLTYLTIRSYLNTKTGKCYPQIRTIVKRSGLSFKYVSDSIVRLKSAGFITVKTRKVNYYEFSPLKSFSSIPFDIFDVDDLTTEERAILIRIRQYFYAPLFQSPYSCREIAGLIGLTDETLTKYYKSLISKGYIRATLETKNNLYIELTDMFDWTVSEEPKAAVVQRELFVK